MRYGYWTSIYHQWAFMATITGLICAGAGIFDYPRPLVFGAGGIATACVATALVGRAKAKTEHWI